MVEKRIESDVVYSHQKYGEVLVTGISKIYDEWSVEGPQEDIESGEVLVFFYDNYDGYGGMNPMPLTEPVGEFSQSVTREKAFEYTKGSDLLEEAVDSIADSMDERDYENIDPEEYMKNERRT